GEAFDQPGFVAGPGRFPEQFGVAAAQVRDAQSRQQSEFLGQVVGHGWLLSRGCRVRFPPVTLSTVSRPSSREFCTEGGGIFPERDRRGRVACRAGAERASEIAPDPRLLAPTLPHVATFGPRSAGFPPPTKRGLPGTEASCAKEERSRCGAVTPGRTCP